MKVRTIHTYPFETDCLLGEIRCDLPKPGVIYLAHNGEPVPPHKPGYDLLPEDDIRETFALAMSDHLAASALVTELPALAAAYGLTGAEVFQRRALEQMAEMSTWICNCRTRRCARMTPSGVIGFDGLDSLFRWVLRAGPGLHRSSRRRCGGLNKTIG